MNYLATFLACLLASSALATEPPRLVSFATADHATIYGDLYGETGRDGVVLAHGAAFDKASWRPLATHLADRGLRVLAIDFRGWGKSTAGETKSALFEDVLGAVRWLHGNGSAHVSVVGASMGAGATAEAAARASTGEIQRVVLLSPASAAAPERIAGDKLVIASEQEPAVERIKALYEKMAPPRRLVLLPGTAHAQHIFATEQADRLTATITEFLSPAR